MMDCSNVLIGWYYHREFFSESLCFTSSFWRRNVVTATCAPQQNSKLEKKWRPQWCWWDMIDHLGIYKKTRPFNHIFGGDRILRAWYRGIKNAGPRKRAQGRAQDIPYHRVSPYHHGIWRIFIECGKKHHARKSAQGRSARVLSDQKATGIFDNPHLRIIWFCESDWSLGLRICISIMIGGQLC